MNCTTGNPLRDRLKYSLRLFGAVNVTIYAVGRSPLNEFSELPYRSCENAQFCLVPAGPTGI